MKRRTFIQTASATALGWLAQASGAQQKKTPKTQPKVSPNISTKPPVLAQSPAQQIINRMQQVAEGGS
jgi:hypothetical protein